MTYFEKTLLAFLLNSRIKMEINGFDMDGFQKAVREEGKRRLEMVEQIVFEDGEIHSDTQKIKAVKLCFQKDFYS